MTNEFNPDWMCVCGDLTALGVVHRKDGPCYYPDKREWVGLTDDEIDEVLGGDIQDEPSGLLDFVRAIEVKLKEKNT